MNRRQVVTGLGAAAFAPLAATAQASFPTRPITLIVPQAPGGTNDIIARFLGEGLGPALGGARIVVENRAGAGGNIGTVAAARAPADGYTLFVTLSSSQAINPSLYARTGFDPVADFEPISMLTRVPNILMVNPSLPVRSVADLLALAKRENANPIDYGSAGNGTLNHLLGEMLQQQAGIRMTHVPYRGVAPMLNDMMGGQVKLGFASLPSVIGFIQSGTLRPIGTSGAQRDPAIPDVPTIAETVPGFSGDVWVALFAPKGLPTPIRDRVLAATHQALAEPSIRERLAAQGATVETSTPDGLAASLKADIERWAVIVRESGARIQ